MPHLTLIRGQVYETKTGTYGAALCVYWQEKVLEPAWDALCPGILTFRTSETQLCDCLSALACEVWYRGQFFAR